MCQIALTRTKLCFLLFIGNIFIGGYLIVNDVSLIGIFQQFKVSNYPQSPDPLSCPLVLTGGRFQRYDMWEPYGCTLHNYSTEDAHACVQHGKKKGVLDEIVLIGDSRVRNLYDAFTDLFSYNGTHVKAHYDLRFEKDGVKIQFIWRACINEIKSTLQSLSALPPHKRPTLIVAACATWCIRGGKGTQAALDDYKANLKALQPYIKKLLNTTTLIWMLQARLNRTAYVMVTHGSNDAEYITNQQLDLYNKAANETLWSSPFQIWSTGRDIADGFFEEMKDGIHAIPRANYWNVQILMNVYCNRRMTNITATCCRKPVHEHYSVATKLKTLSLVLIVCSLCIICIIVRRRRRKTSTDDQSLVGNKCQVTEHMTNHCRALSVTCQYTSTN